MQNKAVIIDPFLDGTSYQRKNAIFVFILVYKPLMYPIKRNDPSTEYNGTPFSTSNWQ